MSDIDQVLKLWRSANDQAEDYVLASIVRVEGSSYRKPGARMLITKGGRRAGTISGGCLEAEVSRQAWWLTEHGPIVKAFSTSFEMDGGHPYGLGCGGVVHLLLERRATAEMFLQQAQRAFARRKGLGCTVVLEGQDIGRRGFAPALDGSTNHELDELALGALTEQQSFFPTAFGLKEQQFAWSEYLPPRCGLFIFGAGDDAQPLVAQAVTLGWQLTVADGRSHLATRNRFPQAHEVVVLQDSEIATLELHASDAAVVMTHSFEQDSRILEQLLPKALLYLGVLGPRYRTVDLVESAIGRIGGTTMEWMKRLHAPVGFDIGGDSPATIALSILAEIQATLRMTRAVAVRSSQMDAGAERNVKERRVG